MTRELYLKELSGIRQVLQRMDLAAIKVMTKYYQNKTDRSLYIVIFCVLVLIATSFMVGYGFTMGSWLFFVYFAIATKLLFTTEDRISELVQYLMLYKVAYDIDKNADKVIAGLMEMKIEIHTVGENSNVEI